VIKKLKFLLVVAMLSLVPLRALAAVTVGLCADSSDGPLASELAAHHHGAHHGAGGDGTSSETDSGTLSVCSLCTACCSGASFAPDVRGVVAIAVADFERTPFYGRDPGTLHPDQLERPPLSR
jgi:hypothetical protein